MAAPLLESDGYRCEIVRRALQYHGGEEMSILNFRRLSLLKLLVPVAALATVLTTISCLDLGDNDDVDERFYGYFLRDAKVMQDMGLPVYWLGRGFSVGALTFQGPYGVEFGGEVEGGGTFTRYVSWLDGTPGEGRNTRLDMTVYSPDAWELAKSAMLNPQLLPGEGEVTQRTVTVKGRQAELISIPNLTIRRPVDRLRLVVELDPVVVVAQATSVLSADGDSELNIFIRNPDLLVQVMQDLRPYPE
jgi:hypothetical protein